MLSKEVVTRLNPYGGECDIDTDRVKEEWDKEFDLIHCYERYDAKLDLHYATFRLIEYDPSDSEKYNLKVTIHQDDALEIIKELGLIPNRDYLIKSSIIYRSET